MGCVGLVGPVPQRLQFVETGDLSNRLYAGSFALHPIMLVYNFQWVNR